MSGSKTNTGNGVSMRKISRLHECSQTAASSNLYRPVDDEQVLKYQHQMIALSFYLTGDHHDSLDLVQDVWLRILRYCVCLPARPDHAMALLAAMTRNLYCDRLKCRRRGCELTPDIEPAAPEQSPQVEQAEGLRWVNEVIAGLPVCELSVVRLRVCGNLTLEEVSKMLEVPLGTVKKRYYRALRRLEGRIPPHMR